MEIIKEVDFVNKKVLREKMIGRLEVLDKVKELTTLSGTDFLTIKQVAEYYGVTERWIKKLISTNGDEIKLDGFRVYRKNEIINLLKGTLVHIKNLKGKTEITMNNSNIVIIPNRGIKLFPKRAVLRIGMLLQNSEVAKEVRTQLLNLTDIKENIEVIEDNISQENELLLNIINADNKLNRALSLQEYKQYNNRHVNKLKNKIDALAEGNITWDKRAAINRMVRMIAGRVFRENYTKAWDKLYAELLYKQNIGVNSRKTRSKLKRPTIFDLLDEEELTLTVKTCLGLCERYEINTDELLIEEVS